jgi:hypothetical protein
MEDNNISIYTKIVSCIFSGRYVVKQPKKI